MGDKEVDIHSLNKYLLHVCYVSGHNREEVLLKALEIMEGKKWDSKWRKTWTWRKNGRAGRYRRV